MVDSGHVTSVLTSDWCRGRVLHCPTCRRQLGDNTSSLAAALIERVKHK